MLDFILILRDKCPDASRHGTHERARYRFDMRLVLNWGDFGLRSTQARMPVPQLRAQDFQVTGYCFDSAEEIWEMKLFVGGMQVVVGQAEAHHDAGNAQVLIECRDDRDGTAGADVHRVFAEHLTHRFRCRLDETIVGIHQRWRGGVDGAKLSGYAFRTHSNDGLL